jgi:hypothetical protein
MWYLATVPACHAGTFSLDLLLANQHTLDTFGPASLEGACDGLDACDDGSRRGCVPQREREDRVPACAAAGVTGLQSCWCLALPETRHRPLDPAPEIAARTGGSDSQMTEDVRAKPGGAMTHDRDKLGGSRRVWKRTHLAGQRSPRPSSPGSARGSHTFARNYPITKLRDWAAQSPESGIFLAYCALERLGGTQRGFLARGPTLTD